VILKIDDDSKPLLAAKKKVAKVSLNFSNFTLSLLLLFVGLKNKELLFCKKKNS